MLYLNMYIGRKFKVSGLQWLFYGHHFLALLAIFIVATHTTTLFVANVLCWCSSCHRVGCQCIVVCKILAINTSNVEHYIKCTT